MINIYTICRYFGSNWTLIFAANIFLLISLVPIAIALVDNSYMKTTETWINVSNGLISIVGEAIALFIIIMLVRKMQGSQFRSGLGLLAISLFYLTLRNILWFTYAAYYTFYLVPKYGNSVSYNADFTIYWTLLAGQELFNIMQSIFIVLAVISLKDIFEAAQKLEIEIDLERTKKEVAKIVESNYFEKIKKDAMELRKKRDEAR